MNDGLVQFLQSKFHLSRERAERRAEWIIAKNAERAAAKKVKLSAAQLTLPIDGAPASGEEPANRFVPDDPTIDF